MATVSDRYSLGEATALSPKAVEALSPNTVQPNCVPEPGPPRPCLSCRQLSYGRSADSLSLRSWERTVGAAFYWRSFINASCWCPRCPMSVAGWAMVCEETAHRMVQSLSLYGVLTGELGDGATDANLPLLTVCAWSCGSSTGGNGRHSSMDRHHQKLEQSVTPPRAQKTDD